MPKIDLPTVEVDIIDKLIANEKSKLYKMKSRTNNEEHKHVIDLWIKRLAQIVLSSEILKKFWFE